MSPRANALRERARPLTEVELANVPWLGVLDERDRLRARRALVIAEAEPGDLICRIEIGRAHV